MVACLHIKSNRRGFSGLPLSKLNGVGRADALSLPRDWASARRA